MQSALVAQVTLQALVPQMNGVHELVAGVTQVPVPLQFDAGWRVEVAQVCAMHCVPLAYFWQAPLPSQKPSLPQLAAPPLVHRAVGSAAPAGTSTQVPMCRVTLQELQRVVQAVLQQTPWAQNPELHEALVVQVAPIDRRPQLIVVVLQRFGGAQSAVEAQVVLHALAVVLHPKGVHRVEVTAWQFPAPSQVLAGVKVALADGQLAGAQIVPAA